MGGGLFTAWGPKQTAIMGGKMNVKVYQDILYENLKPHLYQLWPNKKWEMNNDENY